MVGLEPHESDYLSIPLGAADIDYDSTMSTNAWPGCQHAAAVRRGEEAEALRDGETLAIAFIGATGGGDTLSKLSRHQAGIERSRTRPSLSSNATRRRMAKAP